MDLFSHHAFSWLRSPGFLIQGPIIPLQLQESITDSPSLRWSFQEQLNNIIECSEKQYTTVNTFSRGKSISPIGTSAPVRLATNTLFTHGLEATALSTIVLTSLTFPPRTAWSAVIMVSAFAISNNHKITNNCMESWPKANYFEPYKNYPYEWHVIKFNVSYRQ